MADFTFYSKFIPTLQKLGAEGCADYMNSLGFSSFEVLESVGGGHVPFISTTEQARELRAVFESHGLHAACYSVGVNVYQSEENVQEMIQHAKIAAALGSPFLHHTLIPGLRFTEKVISTEDAVSGAVSSAQRIADFAKGIGITCIYEDQGLYINGVHNFGLFYRELKSRCDNVGICGDMGNTLFAGEEPDMFFAEFAHEIRHVHIKDYLRKSAPQQPGIFWLPTEGGKKNGWVRDTIVGDGTVPIAECVRILRAVRYQGAYALELEHPEPFDEGVRQAISVLSSCLAEGQQ